MASLAEMEPEGPSDRRILRREKKREESSPLNGWWHLYCPSVKTGGWPACFCFRQPVWPSKLAGNSQWVSSPAFSGSSLYIYSPEGCLSQLMTENIIDFVVTVSGRLHYQQAGLQGRRQARPGPEAVRQGLCAGGQREKSTSHLCGLVAWWWWATAAYTGVQALSVHSPFHLYHPYHLIQLFRRKK